MTYVKGFDGIILYDIEMDGCLNGVYTNQFCKGKIANEIDIKIPNEEDSDKDTIVGKYDCQYFEYSGTGSIGSRQAKLDVSLHTAPNVYRFEWTGISGSPSYKGIGYKMNKRQIVVSYWSL